MNQYKIDFESMEWEVPADGVRFKAFQQDGRKLRLVEFSKENKLRNSDLSKCILLV